MVMPFVLFLLTGTTLIGLTLMEKEAQAASVFIADEGSGTVTIVDVAIDLIAHAVKYRIAVDRGPHGLRLSPDARTIAVASTIGRSVSLIGVATGVESRRIYVGRRPSHVAFTPEGNTLLVSLNGEDRIAIVDVGTAKLVDKVGVGHGPMQVSVTPDGGTAVVANPGSTARPDDRVSVIDLRTAAASHVRGGAGAHGVAIQGRNGYVTNMHADALTVLDIEKRRGVRSFKTGRRPNGLAVR